MALSTAVSGFVNLLADFSASLEITASAPVFQPSSRSCAASRIKHSTANVCQMTHQAIGFKPSAAAGGMLAEGSSCHGLWSWLKRMIFQQDLEWPQMHRLMLHPCVSGGSAPAGCGEFFSATSILRFQSFFTQKRVVASYTFEVRPVTTRKLAGNCDYFHSKRSCCVLDLVVQDSRPKREASDMSSSCW